ncbi:XrtB/PEP-CTERM-associated polysaccharide biosynthesis outer membrane protein EpsL [Massilia sp. YIM B04103]|uniref:XrtB/PEP-CTERM-associated polysaccharide biosynthesis outer membrane protein EpsL n=1 Tax=Massilia sp. YIM B04103 TaxID=2963106 RepID=UPI00210CE6DD|nr:XrtB/PEP-CTERM-associated polysaccharide biosynthesis outer membrane protein EpsL [Massilia sp. YIM B04103]
MSRITSKPEGGARILPLALLTALAHAPAGAAISDTVHPVVSVGYTHDSNLLRLPDDTPGFAGQRSDTIRQVQAGLVLERPIGRQKLTASGRVSRVTFNHYRQLDYNGKDFAAELAWQLGNHWEGRVGTTYSQTLTPFTDFHSNELNLRTQRRGYADANWRFHPSWRARAGFNRYKYQYDLAAQSIYNRTEDAGEVGLDYLAASGSRVGVVARKLKGRYHTPRSASSVRSADSWDQDELKANVYWRLSGVTQVTLLAGWARRTHELLPQRDASGANGRVRVDWQPLGRLRLAAEGWREFAAVDNIFVNSSLNRGASLTGSWDISAKLQATASLRREKRRFEGGLGSIVFREAPSDTTKGSSVGLLYAPLPSMQLNLNVFRDQRNGEPLIGSSNYRAHGVSMMLNAQF